MYKTLLSSMYNRNIYRIFNNKDMSTQTDGVDDTPIINNEPLKSEIQQSLKSEIQQPSNDEIQQSLKSEIQQPLKSEIQQPSNDEIQQPLKSEIQQPLNSEISNIKNINKMPLIIGVTGKKFNGKDTLGKYLFKYGYKRLAFADPLKDVLRDVFHFNDEQLYGEDKEKIDPYWKVSPRTIMQFVGTDLFRHQMKKVLPDVGNNIWIEVIKRQILEMWKTNPDQKIVLTDLRFPNEIALIKEFGGIIIRVKRNIDKNDNDFIVVHESETYIDTLNVDYDFDNNGTKDELFRKFDDIIATFNWT